LRLADRLDGLDRCGGRGPSHLHLSFTEFFGSGCPPRPSPTRLLSDPKRSRGWVIRKNHQARLTAAPGEGSNEIVGACASGEIRVLGRSTNSWARRRQNILGAALRPHGSLSRLTAYFLPACSYPAAERRVEKGPDYEVPGPARMVRTPSAQMLGAHTMEARPRFDRRSDPQREGQCCGRPGTWQHRSPGICCVRAVTAPRHSPSDAVQAYDEPA